MRLACNAIADLSAFHESTCMNLMSVFLTVLCFHPVLNVRRSVEIECKSCAMSACYAAALPPDSCKYVQ